MSALLSDTTCGYLRHITYELFIVLYICLFQTRGPYKKKTS